ncbi:MAG: triose-phosphate isomerase [Pseudomonadota bacterium]
MRRHLVAGNWKMNGQVADGVARVEELASLASSQPAACDVLICPPATLIVPLRGYVSAGGMALGGQDCHHEDSGAFTGDVAAPMLADIGCSHVIVGHSERRRDHGETNELVAAKASAAHRAGLQAIICVGETKAERDAGDAIGVVTRQVRESVPGGAGAENTVIAYEPVWAIGTGDTAMPADVEAMHGTIRSTLAEMIGADSERLRLLYGGSVKPDNAVELMAIDDVDGALVGGASLKPADFWAIVQACPRA